MKKMALFVFNGDPMCFIHVLLNALDMKEKGYEAKIIIEGAATQLIPELARPDHPLHGLWEKSRAAGLVEGVCRACAKKLGTLDAAKAEGLPLLADIAGHPAMTRYRDDGFEIISF
ncbi:MAG: cytoplasmic protein [Deltaproteobacteria bacterium]|nr:MAG: cytoplasmic protein [Deltaproteobacteria bacterium]